MNQLKTVPSSQTAQKLPEEKLWYAVIVQAFTDAAYAGNRRDPLYAKREAIDWMTTQGKDFKLVFHYAGYEYEYAVRKVRKLLTMVKYQITEIQTAILTNKKPQSKPSERYKLSF